MKRRSSLADALNEVRDEYIRDAAIHEQTVIDYCSAATYARPDHAARRRSFFSSPAFAAGVSAVVALGVVALIVRAGSPAGEPTPAPLTAGLPDPTQAEAVIGTSGPDETAAGLRADDGETLPTDETAPADSLPADTSAADPSEQLSGGNGAGPDVPPIVYPEIPDEPVLPYVHNLSLKTALTRFDPSTCTFDVTLTSDHADLTVHALNRFRITAPDGTDVPLAALRPTVLPEADGFTSLSLTLARVSSAPLSPGDYTLTYTDPQASASCVVTVFAVSAGMTDAELGEDSTFIGRQMSELRPGRGTLICWYSGLDCIIPFKRVTAENVLFAGSACGGAEIIRVTADGYGDDALCGRTVICVKIGQGFTYRTDPGDTVTAFSVYDTSGACVLSGSADETALIDTLPDGEYMIIFEGTEYIDGCPDGQCASFDVCYPITLTLGVDPGKGTCPEGYDDPILHWD